VTPTPSQTAGPFVSIGTAWMAGLPGPARGEPGVVEVTGVVSDGLGAPVTDAMLEFWQAAPGTGHFWRVLTGPDGDFSFLTPKPGPVPAAVPGEAMAAPHVDVSVFARGLLQRLVTRFYFADEEGANGADPLLDALPGKLRARMLAVAAGPACYRFDVHLQGELESVFFEPW
jgi:protocatechuate 3,4-dioxygenase alpha subunit